MTKSDIQGSDCAQRPSVKILRRGLAFELRIGVCFIIQGLKQQRQKGRGKHVPCYTSGTTARAPSNALVSERAMQTSWSISATSGINKCFSFLLFKLFGQTSCSDAKSLFPYVRHKTAGVSVLRRRGGRYGLNPISVYQLVLRARYAFTGH